MDAIALRYRRPKGTCLTGTWGCRYLPSYNAGICDPVVHADNASHPVAVVLAHLPS